MSNKSQTMIVINTLIVVYVLFYNICFEFGQMYKIVIRDLKLDIYICAKNMQ